MGPSRRGPTQGAEGVQWVTSISGAIGDCRERSQIRYGRELSRRYGAAEETPDDYRELAPGFRKRLAFATSERPLIVVLDALDQLSEAHGARGLTWLPDTLPEHVHLVVSTRRQAGKIRLGACAVGPDRRTIVAGDCSGRVHFLRLEGIAPPGEGVA
jgi:hypothetical protein